NRRRAAPSSARGSFGFVPSSSSKVVCASALLYFSRNISPRARRASSPSGVSLPSCTARSNAFSASLNSCGLLAPRYRQAIATAQKCLLGIGILAAFVQHLAERGPELSTFRRRARATCRVLSLVVFADGNQ